jgi:hypothetical protein
MEYQMMKMLLAAPIVALLASASYAANSQTPLIDKMRNNDLFWQGLHCSGEQYTRFENDKMIQYQGKAPNVVVDDSKLFEKGNTVILANRWGFFTVNFIYTFSADRKTVSITDMYSVPTMTDEQWQVIKAKTGQGKEEFQAMRRALRAAPPLEFCKRRNAP